MCLRTGRGAKDAGIRSWREASSNQIGKGGWRSNGGEVGWDYGWDYGWPPPGGTQNSDQREIE